MLKIFLSALLVSLVAVSSLSGQCSSFVNASDGDDQNPGTQVRPFRSLEFAFETIPDAGTLCVAAGEYFLGLDADGVQFDTQNKSVTLILNAFAGKSEVRISEGSFLRFGMLV